MRPLFLFAIFICFSTSAVGDRVTWHRPIIDRACSASDASPGRSLLQARLGELLSSGGPDRAERVKQEPRNRSVEVAEDPGAIGSSGKDLCWAPPELDENGGWADPNYTATWVPPDAPCPAECPFSQALSEEQCYKACVRAEHCQALHPFRTFADVTTLECTSTCGLEPEHMIVGCNACESVGVCKHCSSFRIMQKGGHECKDYWKYLWKAIYWLAAVLLLLFIGWLVLLQVKPASNAGMLTHANVFRQLSLPWQTQLLQEHETVAARKYPLTTRSDRDDICGLGIALYFRWMQFLLVAVVLLFGVNLVVYHVALEMVLTSAPLAISTNGFAGLSWDLVEPQRCAGMPDGNATYENQTSAGLLETREFSVLRAGRGKRKPRIRSMKKVRLKIKAKAKIKPKTGGSGHDEAGDRPAGDPDSYPRRMALSMLVSYVLLTGSSLAFVLRQKQFTDEWKQERRQHSDFAIVANGFPPDATEPAELKDFFQNALDRVSAMDGAEPADASDLKVIGVSIGYDYREHANFIARAIDWLAEHIDARSELNPGKIATEGSMRQTSAGSMSEKFHVDSSGHSDEEDKTSPCAPHYGPAALMRRSSPDLSHMFTWSSMANHKQGWKSELRKLLSELPNTGHVVVVASSELAQARLLALPPELLAFRGDETALLDICATTAEPPTIAWQFCGHQRSAARMLKHLTILLTTIVLWTAFYVPYAVYNMTAMAVPGEELGEAEDFVLGLLIALGNQLVNMVIERSVEQMGFLERERKEALAMILTFIATVINTFCDVGIVFLVMRGISLQFALHGTLDASHYDRILAREFFALVVPGYLVTPYLMSPLFEDLLPWYVSSRSVRTGDKMKASEAERKMACGEYDVYSRYSDILTNSTVCLCLLTFETPYVYMIMGWLLASLAIMYIGDHYRLLRMASVTYHFSEELSTAFSYWWAVPTGFFASIATFWLVEARMLNPDGADFSYMFLAFAIHCLAYCLVTRWLRRSSTAPRPVRSTYSEMCRRHVQDVRLYDYFNTNPILVLRSWFLRGGEQVPELVPFIRGKEYLQLEGGVKALLRSTKGLAANHPEVRTARAALQARAVEARASVG